MNSSYYQNEVKEEHKVFISYHHANDQIYKEQLLRLNDQHKIFIDLAVDTGDIDSSLDDSRIREIIRDDYLRDSTVTIVLIGTETSKRKHIDWEIYSSMFDGTKNKKSGILVINLPTISCPNFRASHENEKKTVYPEVNNWISIDNRSEYERRYPYMPARIIDNFLKEGVEISVANWDKIINNPEILAFLIDATFNDRTHCNYDLSSPMKRSDS